jgi:hypothetical protein
MHEVELEGKSNLDPISRSESELSLRRESSFLTEKHRMDTEKAFIDRKESEKETEFKPLDKGLKEEKKPLVNEEAFLREEIAKLPEDRRPANIDLALKNMAEGQKVFENIQEGKFFDAVKDDMKKTNMLYFHNEYEREIKLFDKALNSSDEDFWGTLVNELLDNPEDNFLLQISKKIGKKYEAEELLSNDSNELKTLFLSQEFNMYFRLEYTRAKAESYSRYGNFLKIFKASYAKMVVKLQWYLYKKSMLEGKTFTSGMITFKDSDDRCFKFLEGYVELMSPGYRHQNLFSSIFQKNAYTRMSSHYAGQTGLGGKQYGIDLDQNLKNTIGLPSDKGHILFGMRTNGMTFVKWEDFGTTFNVGRKQSDMSLVPHMFNFFHKVGKADTAQEFRESDLKNMKEDFKEIYGKNLSANDEALIKSEGIAGMKKILDRLDDKTKIEQFQKAFSKNFPQHDVSTIPQRKGGEVVLHFDKKS